MSVICFHWSACGPGPHVKSNQYTGGWTRSLPLSGWCDCLVEKEDKRLLGLKGGFDERSPTAQVLAKSCKMIPVMVMGTLIGGKFYSALEYACALMIAAGISLFARQSSSKVTAKLAAPNAPLGYALCLVNLVFDGYTNAAQVQGFLGLGYKEG